MTFSISLLYDDRIHTICTESKVNINFGSEKKDDVKEPRLGTRRITVKCKKEDSIIVTAKGFAEFKNGKGQMDSFLVLDEKSKTCLYFNSIISGWQKITDIAYNCNINVGRSESNDIRINLPFISLHHFKLTSEEGVVRIEDLGSTNGLYLNGNRITKARLKSEDIVSILGLNIKLENMSLLVENAGNSIRLSKIRYSSSVLSYNTATSFVMFKRSPRTREALPSEDIVLAAAPNKGQKYEKKGGMLAGLFGTGGIIVTSMALSAASPALLAARAASMVSPISGYATSRKINKNQKNKLEEYEIRRHEKYSAYIEDQKSRIEAVANAQRTIILRENPEPIKAMEKAIKPLRELWDRSSTDSDFLNVRLGMGYEELCVSVKCANYNNNSFSMEEDDLKALADEIIEETRIVDNVPARLNLVKNNTVGIIGDRKKTIDLVRNMIISITTTHCFEDVHIIGIFDESEKSYWESLKWLPHLWNESKQYRYISFDYESAHSICDLFGEILLKRQAQTIANTNNLTVPYLPYYIFIFGSKEMVEKEEIMKNLFNNSPTIGISSLFLFNDLYSLPYNCSFIIDVDEGPCAYSRDEINKKYYFTPDNTVTSKEFDNFARRMSAIKLEGFASKSEIPSSVTFFSGYGIKDVDELDIKKRWSNSDPSISMAAPIGTMSGNKTFFLDINEDYHGPHGLVAGTTGSGKSETLQTWILSMAVNFHPHDVSFILIDYKGGGMANLLEPLPHVIGKITNIGTNIDRSLLLLKSENERRQRVFSACGVNNINKYYKLYKEGKVKEPLPHLIIVADEFAELKKQQPEFMNGLIQVARIGRTLGIHMVLATQEPNGIIDEQIASNTNFRLCLKVASTASSRTMIGTSEAAEITQSGRSIVKAVSKKNGELYDRFQSYWSGAPSNSNISTDDRMENCIRKVSINGEREKISVTDRKKLVSDVDELTEIIRHICSIAEQENVKPVQTPLKQPLPERISIEDIMSMELEHSIGDVGDDNKWFKIPIGMYDKPINQSQGVQFIDFVKNGHIGIFGAPFTGKTNLLKTIVMSIALSYTPEDVNVYIMDCGGKSMKIFNDLPHVGDIGLDGEDEKVEKLVKLIENEVQERKTKLMNNYVTSLSAYREAGFRDLPAIILVIDNIAVLLMLYPELESFLISISREGAAYGIYMVFTANGSSDVKYKILQNIKCAVCFELKDRGDYISLVGKPENVQLPSSVGTALFYGKPPVYFLAALPSRGNTEMERNKNIRLSISSMKENWNGYRPKPLPVMPDQITNDMLCAYYNIRHMLPIGFGYNEISAESFDMYEKYCMMIIGEPQTGKSRLLLGIEKILMSSFNNMIFVFDGSKHSLRDNKEDVYRYTSVDNVDEMDKVISELIDHLNERKIAQNICREKLLDSFDEKCFIEKYHQICILIDDLSEFIDKVSDNGRDSMERICRLANGLGVMVIAAGRCDDITRLYSTETLTRVIISNQYGISTSTTPAHAMFFNNNLKYNEKNIAPGKGNGFIFRNGKCQKIKFME